MGSLTGWLSNLSFNGARPAAEETRPTARASDEVLPRSRRGAPEQSERVVIYRLGSLGDTIVVLPCLHKIAAVFPNAERLLLTNFPVSAKAAPLPSVLGESGLVHGYLTYPVGERSLRGLWDLARQLRSLKATTLVYLMQSRRGRAVLRDLVFFRLCGFKHILGAPVTRDLAYHRVDPETGIVEYEAQRLTRTLATALGPIDLDDPANWDLHLTAEERAKGAAAVAPFAGRPFIAINMGGKFAQNRWNSDNWRALLGELASTHGSLGIFAVGGPEDAAAVGPVTALWPGPVVNACGTLAPRETAAALEKAQLFIGHDSGPMHLAAVCGVRCVGLFGRLRPRIWHPYGPGHRALHRSDGVDGITVAEVAAAVRDISAVSPTGQVAAH